MINEIELYKILDKISSPLVIEKTNSRGQRVNIEYDFTKNKGMSSPYWFKTNSTDHVLAVINNPNNRAIIKNEMFGDQEQA